MLELFILLKRRFWADLIAAFQEEAYIGQGVIDFHVTEGRFGPDRRNTLFTLGVLNHWHRLSGEVGGAPSLQTFMLMLDGTLSNLLWLKRSLLIAGGLCLMVFKGPFQP